MREELFSGGDRLWKSLRFLGWQHIAGAVLTVFFENKVREKTGGLKASADHWFSYEALREEVWMRARELYNESAGLSDYQFPYSQDLTAYLYTRFRKRNEDECRAFAEEVRQAGGKVDRALERQALDGE